jgi:hypothetical protein
LVDANVSEKQRLSIFRTEVAMLGIGGIYVAFEQGKAEVSVYLDQRAKQIRLPSYFQMRMEVEPASERW